MCGHCMIGTATTRRRDRHGGRRPSRCTTISDRDAGRPGDAARSRSPTAGRRGQLRQRRSRSSSTDDAEDRGRRRWASSRSTSPMAAISTASSMPTRSGSGAHARHTTPDMIAAAKKIIPAVNAQLADPPPRAPRHQPLLPDAVHLRAHHHRRSQADHRLPAGLARPQPLRHRHLGARRGALHTRGELAHRARRASSRACSAPASPASRSPPRSGTACSMSARKVTGRACLTGFHQFVLEPDDPLPEGFRIGLRRVRRPTRRAGAEPALPAAGARHPRGSSGVRGRSYRTAVPSGEGPE